MEKGVEQETKATEVKMVLS